MSVNIFKSVLEVIILGSEIPVNRIRYYSKVQCIAFVDDLVFITGWKKVEYVFRSLERKPRM